jgi:hypothetical protein
MKVKAFRIVRAKQGTPEGLSTANMQEMLKHDCAFTSVNTTIFANLIVFPRFQDRRGTFAGNITHARWATYHTSLYPVHSSVDDQVLKDVRLNADTWVTYQHPLGERGQKLYNILAPFSLAIWQAANSINEVYTLHNRYCSKHHTRLDREDCDTVYKFSCLSNECEHTCYVPK